MNTDSIGVPTRREPFFRTSDYCDGFCCFCTFTQHTQLILRHQLHIVYYKWDISSTPRTCTAALCLVKAPPCSFCRRHHWSRRVRSPARAGASEAYLWTQIRLRFEASYNTRGPIRQRRQRHLSLRKQNSFNCTRLGSPALVEGQWPWGHVWRCGLVWKCMNMYETEKSFLPAFNVGNQPKALDGLVISRAFLRHLVDRCQRSWPCLRRAKMCTRSAVRVAGAKGWHHHGTTLPKDGAMTKDIKEMDTAVFQPCIAASCWRVWRLMLPQIMYDVSWCAKFVSRPKRTCDMLQQMRWLGRLSGQPFHSNMLCWCPKNSDAGQELFPTDAKQARDLRESVWSTR